MNDLSERYDNLFEKVEKLLRQHQQLKEEHNKLSQEIDTLRSESKDKDKVIASLEERISILQTAKSVAYDDEEKKHMNAVLNEYIKEIDRCIALLNN